MDICKEKFTKVQKELLSYLCLHADEIFSQREIAIELNVSPTAIANSVKGLEKYISKKTTKTGNFLSYNDDSQIAKIYKKITNLRFLYESGLARKVIQENAGATVILFGSYAKGEDGKNSDIDFAIIGRKRKEIDLTRFENILNRPINLQYYDSFRKIHENLRNNILNGIILSGSVEL